MGWRGSFLFAHFVMLDVETGLRATFRRMGTQVWFRNPRAYIREIVEIREPRIVFSKGSLVKHNIDAIRLCDLHVPQEMDYRLLVVGNIEQGCAEYHRGDAESEPRAVYPVWSAEQETLAGLEELIQHPEGENPKVCEDANIEQQFRPVLGQEHRVMLTDLPSLSTGPGRKLVKELAELQEEYPDCILHLHGTYSWKAMFGLGFRSCDMDGRTDASKGAIQLPNGKKVSHKRAGDWPQWVTLLNFKPVELEVPRNRCMYNMKSGIWAGKHYATNENFRVIGTRQKLPDTPDAFLEPARTKSHKTGAKPYADGDKFVCDTCSIQKECKYFRAGAVCSVPDSEPVKLSQLFNTRDTDSIIEGLSALLGAQADRLERGMETEEYSEELDPEVSKLINSLFSNGVKLAKLTNPELAGGTKVGVFVNGGQGAGVAVGSSASQLTAAIVRELEAKGIPRDEITPEMIGNVINGESQTQPAIEARSAVEAKRD